MDENLKSVEFDGGKIWYRGATIPRVIRIMPPMRELISKLSNSKDGVTKVEIDENDIIAGVMEKCDKIITKIEHPEITTFDQLLESPKALTPLSVIATEYFNLFVMANTKETEPVKKPVE